MSQTVLKGTSDVSLMNAYIEILLTAAHTYIY